MAKRWQGTFVSTAEPSTEGGPAPYFRREFSVESGLRRATWWVTALGIVEPYLNGTRVGDEVLAPGWTSYKHRILVSSYDVTDLVDVGVNAFGVIVGEGWAAGALTWENRRHNYSDRPAVYAQLELVYDDHTDVISTDDHVRVGAGAVRASGIYAGETYNAGQEPSGWSEAGFDDAMWPAATPYDWDLGTLEERTSPPVMRIEELAPVSLATRPSGTTMVDFGQVLSGWVRITVDGSAGTTVTLRHAEVLTPDGDLERETNRTAEATDRYTLRGDGPETWEPGFTFHGFRYVELEGWPGELDADSLRAIVIHSDMARTGWFETSNELVTKLHDNVVWSMRGNFVGVPTDCPQRDERLGWTGDLNAFAPTATYLYDVRGVLQSWLKDLAVEQLASGTVPWDVPDVLPTPSTPTALWSDVAISLPWVLYQEYGDLEILRASYPSMSAFMRQVEVLLDDDGLWGHGFQFGDWLDPDAPKDNPAGGKTDRYLVATAYLCKTTRELAESAALLDEDEDATHFARLHERVRAAFRHEFVSAGGRVVNESATAYALAIAFDILDDDQLAKAGDRLAEIVEAAGYRISTGFAGTPLVTDALTRTGHPDVAYKMLLEKRCPSFLYPVTMGATTIWERWDSILPDGTLNSTGMTSLNHYALGAIADWLHRVVGGLSKVAPGWTRMLIAPQPGGGLTSASTAHETPYGRASVAWRVDSGEMVLDVTIPEGTTARVVAPLHAEGATYEIGAGTYGWRYPAPPGYGEAVALTMDTPIKVLMDDPEVWPAVVEVFRTYFPGVPLDAAGSHLAAMPLSAVVGRLPGAGPELEQALLSALAHQKD